MFHVVSGKLFVIGPHLVFLWRAFWTSAVTDAGRGRWTAHTFTPSSEGKVVRVAVTREKRGEARDPGTVEWDCDVMLLC